MPGHLDPGPGRVGRVGEARDREGAGKKSAGQKRHEKKEKELQKKKQQEELAQIAADQAKAAKEAQDAAAKKAENDFYAPIYWHKIQVEPGNTGHGASLKFLVENKYVKVEAPHRCFLSRFEKDGHGNRENNKFGLSVKLTPNAQAVGAGDQRLVIHLHCGGTGKVFAAGIKFLAGERLPGDNILVESGAAWLDYLQVSGVDRRQRRDKGRSLQLTEAAAVEFTRPAAPGAPATRAGTTARIVRSLRGASASTPTSVAASAVMASAVPAVPSPRPTSGAVTAPSANWVRPSSADADPAIRRCRSIAIADACGSANPTADTMTNSDDQHHRQAPAGEHGDGQQRSRRPAPDRRPRRAARTTWSGAAASGRSGWPAMMPIAFSAKQALNHCADSPNRSCSRNGEAEM